MHFANCRRELDNPSLEAAVTCEYWTDRIIRSSNEETVPNEIMFSMSFNGNLPMTRDLAGRISIVRLNNQRETANEHEFKTDLHGQLSRYDPPEEFMASKTYICRRNVLAALDALAVEWLKQDAPYGPSYTSYPEWGRIVGGIVNATGFGNPCKEDQVVAVVGTVDDWERDLIQLAKLTDPEKCYKSRELTSNFIQPNRESFPAFTDYIDEHSIAIFNSELSQYLNSKLGMPLSIGPDTCVVTRLTRTRVPRFAFNCTTSSVGSATNAPENTTIQPATPHGLPLSPPPGELCHFSARKMEEGENRDVAVTLNDL